MADDERRTEIEAATDALLAGSGLPRYGRHRATIERRMTIAFDAADRVRDARGEGEGAQSLIEEDAAYWRQRYEEALHAADPPKVHRGVERILLDDGREFVLARSPQGEDHEA